MPAVSCAPWNNAVDQQGNHNSRTSAVPVHIDEAPLASSFEPVNSDDPSGLVADTSDRESGVAGRSIEMAPSGSQQMHATADRVTGSHLVAHFDDAAVAADFAYRNPGSLA